MTTNKLNGITIEDLTIQHREDQETLELSRKHQEQLDKEIEKWKASDQRKTIALLDIANDMIKKAQNGRKYIKDRKIMTDKELIDYYNKQEKTWKQRKQSYLHL